MVEAGQELTARALVSLLRGSRRQARRQAAVGYARAEMWAWRGAAEAESHAAAHDALQVVAVGLFVQLWIHYCAVDSKAARTAFLHLIAADDLEAAFETRRCVAFKYSARPFPPSGSCFGGYQRTAPPQSSSK